MLFTISDTEDLISLRCHSYCLLAAKQKYPYIFIKGSISIRVWRLEQSNVTATVYYFFILLFLLAYFHVVIMSGFRFYMWLRSFWLDHWVDVTLLGYYVCWIIFPSQDHEIDSLLSVSEFISSTDEDLQIKFSADMTILQRY